jgi:glutamyl-tRNA reductase
MTHHVLVIGLNHTTAPVDVRERVTFADDVDGALTRGLLDVECVDEAMILATCNRSEVIATTSDPDKTETALIDAIADMHDMESAPLQEFLYLKRGPEAVRHVFRVSSSLDSMVLGEPQILGQVKDSYRKAAMARAAGPVINRLMHRGFFTAKRVRSETGVGLAAISVAYVAVELARKILGELQDKRVLLIGAGEMAELAARHLISQVEQPLTCINRTYETACTLATNLCGTALPMDQLDEGLVSADVVITSTGSSDPIILKDRMKAVMRRRRYLPVFIIDIAIPRDVEPSVNDVDGVYLYNIDDLQAVADENLGERQKEALKAEKIVEEEVRKFMAWSESLAAAPTIVALKDKLEHIRSQELSRLNGKFTELDPEQKEAVEQLTRSIINKIAHEPITFLKKAAERPRRNAYLDVAQRLFGLNGLTTDPNPQEEVPPEE